MRKSKINRKKYVRKRREYKIWCSNKRRRHEEEKKRKVEAIRTEEEAWKYIINIGEEERSYTLTNT